MTLPLHVETCTVRRELGNAWAAGVAALLVMLLAFSGAHPVWMVATAAPVTVLVIVRRFRTRPPSAVPSVRMRISSDGIDVPLPSGLAHLAWDELDAVRVHRCERRTEVRLEPTRAGHEAVAVDLTGSSVTVVELAASVNAASRGRLRLSLA